MFLRQSTASQEIVLGRFVDSTDGNTEETGLTIANTDIKLWKGGATSAVSKNSGGATHAANGNYSAVLDATDTDTLGNLEVHCHVAGALAVKRSYVVLHANVYDWLFGSAAPNTTAPLDAAGVRTAMGLATNNLDTQLSTIDDFLDTEIAAIKAKTDNLPADPADASDIATSFSSLATTLSTIAGYIDTEVAAIKAKTDNLPAAPAATGDIPSAATVAAAVLAAGDVDGFSLEETLKLCLAALAAKLSGAATTTITIRAADDSKTRITATVDADGNRSAVTLDAA